MTDNRAKALEALELCRQYRKTPQGDMVLELMEPLVFDWFCKNEETIRTALIKSAKVDELVSTLELIRDAIHGEASSLRCEAKFAIQRFNGEV